MKPTEILKAIEVLLIQSNNGYYLSPSDIKRAELAIDVINNILKATKALNKE